MRKSSPTSSAGGSIQPKSWFERFASFTAHVTGRPATFLLATAVVVTWAVTGPLFGYSDTWQLVINTGTTIVTFLMVFLIQATQNRDTTALELKLDELILVTRKARNEMACIEDEPVEKLEHEKTKMLRRAENDQRPRTGSSRAAKKRRANSGRSAGASPA